MMASSSTGKQYGLIIPKKDRLIQDISQRPSIFNEDSDSAGSGNEGDWIKKAYQRETKKSVEKRQTKLQVQDALNQDATIYQYDEVYDDIKEKAESSKPSSKKDEKKKPRYIQSLLKTAERRKLENERRNERLVQKERSAEGDQFKDKETFVTSGYRKKLEEFNKLEEEEQRQDMLEEIGDVSKQKDLSGFYRHLYRVTVDNEDTKKVPKPEPDSAKKTSNTGAEVSKATASNQKHKRHYRKHKSESSLEEGQADDSDTDATSSSSSSSTSSSSSESGDEEEEVKSDKSKKRPAENADKNIKTADKNKKAKTSDTVDSVVKPVEEKKCKEQPVKENESKVNENENDIKVNAGSEQIVHQKPVKPNIWEKRTVGAVFDDALKRFFERKSMRQGSY